MASRPKEPTDWVEYNRALAKSLRQKIEDNKLTRRPTPKPGRA